MILEEPIKGGPLVKNFIDGEWVESKGEIRDVVNPAKYEVIAKVPISTKEEIDAAVEAAKAAFPTGGGRLHWPGQGVSLG